MCRRVALADLRYLHAMLKLRNALTLLGLAALICAVGCKKEEADTDTAVNDPVPQAETTTDNTGGTPQVGEMMDAGSGPQ